MHITARAQAVPKKHSRAPRGLWTIREEHPREPRTHHPRSEDHRPAERERCGITARPSGSARQPPCLQAGAARQVRAARGTHQAG